MQISKRKRYVAILILAVLLAMVSWPTSSWLLTERTIRKLLAEPICSLSEKESKRVTKYMKGSTWYQRLGSKISRDRQAKLVEAAVERTAKGIDDGLAMIFVATAQWQASGAFPNLPEAVNDAIVAGKPHTVDMLCTVGAEKEGKIDPYIDVEFIMRSSNDHYVVAMCSRVLTLERLYDDRQACLDMLRREDIPVACKRMLLAKIAGYYAGAKWFAGEEELLQHLQSNDRDIGLNIEKIREQIKDPEAANKQEQKEEYERQFLGMPPSRRKAYERMHKGLPPPGKE